MDIDALREKLERSAALNRYSDGDPAPITRGELKELLSSMGGLELEVSVLEKLHDISSCVMKDAEREVRAFRDVAEELCRAATVDVDTENGRIGYICPLTFQKAVSMAYKAVLRAEHIKSREDAARVMREVHGVGNGQEV